MIQVNNESITNIVYPVAPAGANTAVPPDVVWNQLEASVSARWSTSQIQLDLCADHPCHYRLPYYPISNPLIDGAAATVNEFGEVFIPLGRHMLRADLGGLPVTSDVEESYIRLARYLADTGNLNGYSRYSVNLGGEIAESWTRRIDKGALGNSGAADLLKPYRKLGIAHV